MGAATAQAIQAIETTGTSCITSRADFRQDGDQERADSSLRSSPEQAQFLVSPTEGEGFFSDPGNDFSSGFFGGGNNKKGEEDDGFFASFDDSVPADGGFSFFGDSEGGKDDDFMFDGEEKDDNDDGGFSFF